MEEDEGDGVGCEGEEDAEKGTAFAWDVVVPEEGERFGGSGFGAHLPNRGGAIFVQRRASGDGDTETVLEGGLGGSEDEVVGGGSVTVDDDGAVAWAQVAQGGVELVGGDGFFVEENGRGGAVGDVEDDGV